jgi:hypothetical protein
MRRRPRTDRRIGKASSSQGVAQAAGRQSVTCPPLTVSRAATINPGVTAREAGPEERTVPADSTAPVAWVSGVSGAEARAKALEPEPVFEANGSCVLLCSIDGGLRGQRESGGEEQWRGRFRAAPLRAATGDT